MTEEVVSAAQAPTGSVTQGDAFDLIKDIGDESIDLILTSPPYWGLRSYGLPHQDDILSQWADTGCDTSRVPPYDWYRDAGGMLGQEPFPDWYVTHLVEFFNRARRKIKTEGSVWVNLGDTYFARWGSLRDNGRQGLVDGRRRRKTPSGGYLHDKQLLMIPARFAIAMQEAGWILRNDLIWSKSKIIPRPEVDRLRLSHEHWFHFVLRQPRGRPHYYYDIKAAESGALDVVQCDPEPGEYGHTATFPSQLIRPRILTTCPSRGVILDPFCGTGRALSEAVRLGRTAIGFELAETYAMAARRALKSENDESTPAPQTLAAP